MKTIICILCVLLVGCSRPELGYVVYEGKNEFHPQRTTWKFTGDVYDATVMIGEDWFTGDLTVPAGFGCKLNCIGRWNYHNGGCNFAISQINGRCYISARYYEPIESGYYKLHEGCAQREILPNRPVNIRITFSDSTRFYIDGQKVATVMPLPHDWITPPFLGRSGRDNNYQAEPIPGAFAVRDLRLYLTLNY